MATLKHYRYWCTLELKDIFEWRDDGEGVPPDCRNDQAPITNIVIVEEQPRPDDATRNLAVRNNVLLVTRAIIGGKIVPASAGVVDTIGCDCVGLSILTPAAAEVDIHRSRNSDDPANQAAIDAAILAGDPPPPPDYSNINFDIYLGQQYLSVGPNDLDEKFLSELTKSRYIQIEAVRGTITDIEAY